MQTTPYIYSFHFSLRSCFSNAFLIKQHSPKMQCFCSLHIWTAAVLILLNSFFAQRTSAQNSCLPGNIRVGLGCQVCPPGTFSDGFNQLECTPCRPGTFRKTSGAVSIDQCRPCAEGTFSARAAVSCTPCPKGKFSRQGSRMCTSCPPGTILGPGFCRNCRSGTFNDKVNAITCERCPPGTFSESGAKICSPCPAGTFRRGIFSCSRCPFGMISQSGATECTICSPGSVPNQDRDGCIPCRKNTFSRFVVEPRCAPCPAGKSTKSNGAAGCKRPGEECPFDTFENQSGNCVACAPGQRMDMNSKTCVKCGNRSFSLGGSTTSCTKCAGGSFINMKGRLAGAECTCPDGYTFEGEECVPCPKGSFGQGGSCRPCPFRSFSDKVGSVECKPCPENSISNFIGFSRSGADVCIPCPPGTERGRFSGCVNSESGCFLEYTRDVQGKCVFSGSCSTPDVFQTLNSDGEKICKSCGTFQRRLNGECVPCEPGEVSNGGRDTECRKCPPRQTPNREGPGCVCETRFQSVGGECLPRCQNFVSGECGECEAGSVLSSTRGLTSSDLPFRDLCRRCLGNSIAVNRTTCVACGPGLVVGETVFRRRLDVCVPK